MLTENRISDNGEIVVFDKVQVAINRIQYAYEVSKHKGLGSLYVAFSGGKDSTVLAELVRLSGVPYTLNYNITGIDPPELIYFMRDNYNAVNPVTNEPFYPDRYSKDKIDLYWHMYDKSLWELIAEKHMPPTRLMRYCCKELKEHGGKGKICLTGIRWAESVKRSKRRTYEIQVSKKEDREKYLFNDNDTDRRQFEQCTIKGKLVSNPIIDWSDSDVWYFIKQRSLPYCKLYDEGEKRLGCIGCPMGNKKGMEADFKRYPKFKDLYIIAFDKMLKNMNTPTSWKTGQDVFDWWVKSAKAIDEKQMTFLID